MFRAHGGTMTIRNQVSTNLLQHLIASVRDPDVALAARTDACILLTGLPDAARELAYRFHLSSGWRHGPFTVIDCRESDPGLEARVFDALFPSDSPAQTGALQLRLVQAGTVLLQEISFLPLVTQRRLARRLSELLPGPQRSRRRLIASSSEPLFDRVMNGTFDDNLFYRLNVMQFTAKRMAHTGASAPDQ
jgi:two-component system nitrogen regulation response regulator NtrX